MLKNRKLVFIIITLGVILRLLHWALPVMDSDMAVTGLMAMHILKGEFPTFFWDQDYCGAIEAYLVSVFFAIFGVSRYTLNIVPVLESILFMILMYILARRIFGEKVGILTLLFTAVPPVYLAVNTVLARANYVENLVLGAVVFYLTYRIVYEAKKKNSGRRFFLLGLVCGLAWWTNYQSIYFILTSLFFLFLRQKLIFFTRRFLNFLFGFFVGSSPFWLYCFKNDFLPFKTLGENKFTDIGLALEKLFIIGLPVIMGVVKSEPRTVYLPFLSQMLLVLYLAAFLYVFKDRLKGLLNLMRLSLRESNGMEMFIVFFLVFILIYILSGYALTNTCRYLLVLYLCLPVYLAYFIAGLGNKYKKLSFLVLGIVFTANVQQNIISIDLLNKEKREAFLRDQKNKKEFFGFLENKGIKYVYMDDYWMAYQYTFDARERIIFTQFYPGRYPEYLEAANRSKDAAIFFTGIPEDFIQMLESIGTESYKMEAAHGATLFYGFKPLERTEKTLDLSTASVKSNFNQTEVKYTLDSNLETRWTTRIHQSPGMYFEMDLGREEEICRVMLDLDDSVTDYPHGYIFSTSPDGKTWREVESLDIIFGPLHWGKFHPIWGGERAKLEICFEPHRARFIKITQTGEDKIFWWSIYEFEVYGIEASTKRVQ